ncbi:hypothetical protein BJ684DRAFT_18167 [Piptocephalis cylindrospora]|uniref:Autophagy-related protein 27 n=1 Tax=Piptocephalis cylindrospora TaxID=1907219 RepID=A0A4V1IYR7_9FUNG|nr:hypothetical protein BJ684DRAFT_18167 [Piptocephalis cylindrospora]|eukprot:RKP15499.1 hypothetical protein BJ684DRAFT_18167 [Piptocephalis cylindrospora]
MQPTKYFHGRAILLTLTLVQGAMLVLADSAQPDAGSTPNELCCSTSRIMEETPGKPGHWYFRVSATMTEEELKNTESGMVSINVPEGYRPVGWGRVPQPKNGSFHCRVNKKRTGWECMRKGPGALSPLQLTVKSKGKTSTPPRGLVVGYEGKSCSSNPTCPVALVAQAKKADEEDSNPLPAPGTPEGEGAHEEHDEDEEMKKQDEGQTTGMLNEAEPGGEGAIKGTDRVRPGSEVNANNKEKNKGTRSERSGDGKSNRARTDAMIGVGCVGALLLLAAGFVIWRRAHATVSRSGTISHQYKNGPSRTQSLLSTYASRLGGGWGQRNGGGAMEEGRGGARPIIPLVRPRKSKVTSTSSSLTPLEACLMSNSGTNDWMEQWEGIRLAARLGPDNESLGILRAISALETPAPHFSNSRRAGRSQSMRHHNPFTASSTEDMMMRDSVQRSLTQPMNRGSGALSLLGPGDAIKEESSESAVPSVDLVGGSKSGSTVYHSAAPSGHQ